MKKHPLCILSASYFIRWAFRKLGTVRYSSGIAPDWYFALEQTDVKEDDDLCNAEASEPKIDDATSAKVPIQYGGL